MNIRHFLHKLKVYLLYGNSFTPMAYKALCKLHIKRPYVIVYVDGGICSQMHQYLLGRYYAEKGYHVAYDLGWYRRNGMDNNGIFERRFEFCNLFPNLPFKVATTKMVAFYSRVFSYKRHGMTFPTNEKSPIYLGGYYTQFDNKSYAVCFRRYFNIESVFLNLNCFNKRGGVKCAVHVRRGDLAKMDDCFYGKVTVEYFNKAMLYMKQRFPQVKFYFFSDEMDWVEENLIGFCKKSSYEYELMKGNKAYEDLYLMACCDHQIASQGSAGKIAAMMNGKGLLLISNDSHDMVWKERYDNTVVIESN